jgi:hypothetical protein
MSSNDATNTTIEAISAGVLNRAGKKLLDCMVDPLLEPSAWAGFTELSG